jgi:hypothetical protein
MEIKDMVTEKGSRAFICYNTTLITLIPSQSMEKYTTRVEIEASCQRKCVAMTTEKTSVSWTKKL